MREFHALWEIFTHRFLFEIVSSEGTAAEAANYISGFILHCSSSNSLGFTPSTQHCKHFFATRRTVDLKRCNTNVTEKQSVPTVNGCCGCWGSCPPA